VLIRRSCHANCCSHYDISFVFFAGSFGDRSMSSDELEMTMKELRIREMERKATFESTQSDIRRNDDLITTLRRENKELRSALQVSAKGGTVNSSQYNKKESDLLSQKITVLRRTLNDMKNSNEDLEKGIATLAEATHDIEAESAPILTEESPLQQSIRMLENRLDKSLIKHNEAMSIRRTYEAILKRLQEERTTFDNQLAAIEKTLRSKEHDYMELQSMAHDAMHAKEIAKAAVQEFKTSYAEERKQKKKELEDRMNYVRAKKEQFEKQEKQMKVRRAQEEQQAQSKVEEDERRKRELMQATVELRTEEEQERLQQYSDAYRRIKDVTRASNVTEVISKFIAQEDTSRTLMQMTTETQSRIDQLIADRAILQQKVDEGKYSGSGQLGSRRIVDEFETHLNEAKALLEKSQGQFEDTSRQIISVKAGVEHLAEKLSGYRPEMVAPSITDDNIVDVLKHCESKLQMLLEEVNPQEIDEAAQLSGANIEVPANNTRVNVVAEHEDEEEEKQHRGDGKGDLEDAEDDPHDRLVLKQMSISAVERENKKARKRRNKEGEGV
jgi:chromosome segregation ATPase